MLAHVLQHTIPILLRRNVSSFVHMAIMQMILQVHVLLLCYVLHLIHMLMILLIIVLVVVLMINMPIWLQVQPMVEDVNIIVLVATLLIPVQ